MMDDGPFESPLDHCPAGDEAHTDLSGVRAVIQAGRALTLRVRRALRPVQMAPETWLLLEALVGAPKRPRDLTEDVAGLKGSVSRWIATLERAGFVECNVSSADLRFKEVRLTTQGEKQLQQARALIGAAMTPLPDELAEEQGNDLVEKCRGLLAALPPHGRRRAP